VTVKVYLDYLQIEYETIEVNPLDKKEIKFSTTKKVPIAALGGQIIEDSNNIIDFISATLLISSSRTVLSSQFLPADTAHWQEWSEKKLAVMLYPNITRSFAESWECFEYSNHVSTWNYPQRLSVRLLGPIAMFFANGKIKKKYGIVDERKELQEVLNVWCDALKGQNFLHGNDISLPDLLVFGVLKSIEGLTTFNVLMQENVVLREWYERVSKLTVSMATVVK